MTKIKRFLMNRKYSSRMIFFLALAFLTILIIQERYGLEENATETILTPPQYEEYSRIMLLPIILMSLVPINLGMWYKEVQLRKKGLLIEPHKKIPNFENYELEPITVRAGNLTAPHEITGEKENEQEQEQEYIIE